MAAEFHQKTAALFEEFKKRELCYLNAERKTNSNLSWKNDFYMPTPDYLEKINKRETETEKTYRDLMKHLEDLDKRTDQMSLKLEKLNVLRNIATSSSTWPSVDDTFDRPLQSYYASSFLQNAPAANIPFKTSISALHPLSEFSYSLPQFRSQSVSTQTDYVFCNQCHCPLNISSLSSTLDMSNAVKPSTNFDGSMKHKLNEAHQPSEPVISSKPTVCNDIITEQSDMDKKPISNENLNHTHLQESSNEVEGSKVKTHSKIDNVSEKDYTFTKLPNDSVKGDRTEENERKSEDIRPCMIENQSVAIADSSLDNTEILEEAVTKSDDESMNHEFDFLESDKKTGKINSSSQLLNSISRAEANIKESSTHSEARHGVTYREENISSSNTILLLAEPPDSKCSKQHPKEVSMNTIDCDLRSKESIKIAEDLRIDSSVSVGLPSPSLHSENASLASESDSFSEKETPMTATAAYQALLGNVSAIKTSQSRQPITESDSEDEIENALATAVRKSSNVTFDTGILNQKTAVRKESIVEVKSKIETKTSSVASKPQNKLSKNTRKVLGLDTSSGSEVELAIKEDVNKIAEDSDEFDFYD